MNESGLQKSMPSSLKDKSQYAVAFGVVALMLYVAGFPVFLLFFVGVLTFFIWKVFSSEGRHETRRIFEFYLTANEILRDDERKWYGFEIQEAIARGETIARSMTSAPPLVYFGLGALYQKIDDHSSAVKNLSRVVDDTTADELSVVYPGKDVRDYVRMLRKIERSPAETPLTAKAVRALERGRKNRAKDLLERSRAEVAKITRSLPESDKKLETIVGIEDRADGNAEAFYSNGALAEVSPVAPRGEVTRRHVARQSRVSVRDERNPASERQTISEVLHDIYDRSS